MRSAAVRRWGQISTFARFKLKSPRLMIPEVFQIYTQNRARAKRWRYYAPAIPGCWRSTNSRYRQISNLSDRPGTHVRGTLEIAPPGFRYALTAALSPLPLTPPGSWIGFVVAPVPVRFRRRAVRPAGIRFFQFLPALGHLPAKRAQFFPAH